MCLYSVESMHLTKLNKMYYHYIDNTKSLHCIFQASYNFWIHFFLNCNDYLARPRNRISWALKSISFAHFQKVPNNTGTFLPRTSILIQVLIRQRNC